MKHLLWRVVATVVSQPLVADRLIQLAERTPYMHIYSPDGQDVYMGRWWLLNPYSRDTRKPRFSWLPFSIRVHRIFRADYDAHCHDHPWDARTIILRGGYTEKRLATGDRREEIIAACCDEIELAAYRVGPEKIEASEYFDRRPGDTASLSHGEYHSITEVMPGGAVTLFITFRHRGSWGYLVGGVKVHWKKYLGLADDQDLPDLRKGK